MFNNGFDYFLDPYNYLELTPLVSATTTMVLYLKYPKEDDEIGSWLNQLRTIA